MRRTIETAYYIFKDHPDIKEMKFIVDPRIREKIMIGSDAPCWNSFKMIQEEYVAQFQKIGIELDLSLIE